MQVGIYQCRNLKRIAFLIVIIYILSGCAEKNENQITVLNDEIVVLKQDIEQLEQTIELNNEEINDLKNQIKQKPVIKENVDNNEDKPIEIYYYEENGKTIYISRHYGVGFIFKGELNEHFQMLETDKYGFGVYYVGDVVEAIKTFKVSDKIHKYSETGEEIPYLFTLKDNLILYDMHWFLVNISMIDSDIWRNQINPYIESIEFEFIDVPYGFKEKG